MSTPAWPEVLLPLPSEAVQIANNNNLTRTQMESGVVRQRARFNQLLRNFAVRWTFTDLQYAAFQSFVQTKLAYGALWFTMPLTTGDYGIDETATVRIVGGNYNASRNHPCWVVEATLEADTTPKLLPEAGLDLLIELAELGIALDSLVASSADFHTLIHTELPELMLPA